MAVRSICFFWFLFPTALAIAMPEHDQNEEWNKDKEIEHFENDEGGA